MPRVTPRQTAPWTTVTEGQDEDEVWSQLQGRRFHQLANPNPQTAADITSTWTIPCAGKDELIFHDDGTYAFEGNVHFPYGHILSRAGIGQYRLFQDTVREGTWIAQQLARLAGGGREDNSRDENKNNQDGLCDAKEPRAEHFVGRVLWKVQICGPELTQDGDGLDMDDVNECGVLTVFEPEKQVTDAKPMQSVNRSRDRDNGRESGSDMDMDMPTLAIGGGRVKKIQTMTWWVDDVLSWNSEKWLSPDQARRREAQKRNPDYRGIKPGFLSKQTTRATETAGGVALIGTGDEKEEISFTQFAPPANNADSKRGESTVASRVEVGAKTETATVTVTNTGAEIQGLRQRYTGRKTKVLPPLVPQRADKKLIETVPHRPHTYCGVRAEDWLIFVLSALCFVVSLYVAMVR